VTIRLATSDDLPTLAKLVHWASEEMAKNFASPRLEEQIFGLIKYGIEQGEAVVVAEQFGDLIGWCAWVHIPTLPKGHVEGLGTWVHKPYRREHVARDMRKLAAEHCRLLGHLYVCGNVAEGNEAGLKSAERDGFRVTGYLVRKEL